MQRDDVIARLKQAEPALREHGVAALFLFGSHARDEARSGSDVDVFIDPESEDFYSLENYMGAYEEIQKAFPGIDIGYATRRELSKYVRPHIEEQAIRIF